MRKSNDRVFHPMKKGYPPFTLFLKLPLRGQCFGQRTHNGFGRKNGPDQALPLEVFDVERFFARKAGDGESAQQRSFDRHRSARSHKCRRIVKEACCIDDLIDHFDFVSEPPSENWCLATVTSRNYELDIQLSLQDVRDNGLDDGFAVIRLT